MRLVHQRVALGETVDKPSIPITESVDGTGASPARSTWTAFFPDNCSTLAADQEELPPIDPW